MRLSIDNCQTERKHMYFYLLTIVEIILIPPFFFDTSSFKFMGKGKLHHIVTRLHNSYFQRFMERDKTTDHRERDHRHQDISQKRFQA